mmetsp:Transcript_15430/g.33891  ORF Transcript_15430/g.33891 Transcript_15430/m.33891 type:complete len:445 (+) Transcript_15430:79-1413(+)
MMSAIIRRTAGAGRRRAMTFSSASSVANLDGPPPEVTPSKRPRNIYMWGTSSLNTLPLDLIQKNDATLTGGGSGGLFSSDAKIIDHPMKLQIDGSSVDDFFGHEGDEPGDDSPHITRIDCGASGSAFILSDGRSFAVGSNKNGQLGVGSDTKETSKPVLLDLPPVAKAALGNNFSALLTEGGDIYTCGFGGSRMNGMGCLGHGDDTARPAPTLVNSLVEDGCYAKDVHVGEYSMTALTTEGEVLTCGSGSYGRLGNLETVDQLYLEPVELIGNDNISQIAGGSAFSLALNQEGVIYGWGRNNEGQLGTGMGMSDMVYAMEALPLPVEGNLEGKTVVKISAGKAHSAAVTSEGELFTWGMNLSLDPKLESSLLHTKIVDVACGEYYTMVLDEAGRLYSLGRGKTGVLGLASTTSTAYPILVEGIPSDEKVVSVSCGSKHVSCITE